MDKVLLPTFLVSCGATTICHWGITMAEILTILDEMMVPKLMFQQKWFNSDKELKKGDLVFFRKKESKLEGRWIIGIIDTLERGRDGLIRMVWVKYQNNREKHSQLTSRTVRQLVKLWSIEDQHIADDDETPSEKDTEGDSRVAKVIMYKTWTVMTICLVFMNMELMVKNFYRLRLLWDPGRCYPSTAARR